METGMGVVIIIGLIVIGFVISLIVDAWSMNQKRQTEKEIQIEAIKAGLVQAPVVKIVLDAYEQEKQITELAWVEKQ